LLTAPPLRFFSERGQEGAGSRISRDIPLKELERHMVKIRLTRGGAKKRPHYRIIAIDHHSAREGRPLEYLGTYDPQLNPEKIELKTERLEAWVAKGAKLSPTVRSLVKRARKQAAGVS
jgi:small subunit ribosomal protein S16